ncbi:HlyD family secretion protein [Salinimicrobium sp. WS361]|uniref:HlyD family secretion protein n=1 Tax=Salinimicrobium sp. WS361 TaxID=3425123 RepID=UPI003D6E7478
MNLYSRIIVSIIAVISLGSCNNDERIPALRGKVKFETIAVSGKLPGRIIEISVEEGQEVKKGDTLAFIDIPEVNAKMKQAEGAVTAARGQLDMAFNGATLEQLEQIEGQLNAGKAQLDFAKESFKRIEAMYQDSLVSRQQYDEVKMKLGMARAQVDALQAKQQEVEKGARTEQINQAQGQLDRALGSKEEVMSASMEQYLIAPKDMTIETVSLSEGELLTPGYPLFNGYEKNSMYFRFSIPESQVYDFKVGDVLTVVNPYTKEEISSRLVAVKQLAHYSDISSTAPMYQLSEPVYELKLVPESTAAANYFMNSTIILKH